jgi:hypothetical protein
MEPRNRFQGINSASLCSLAGWYDNPIPTRFLAPIDCLKIPPLLYNVTQSVIPPRFETSCEIYQEVEYCIVYMYGTYLSLHVTLIRNK